MRRLIRVLSLTVMLFSTVILTNCGGLIGAITASSRRTLSSKDEGKSTVVAFIKGPDFRSYNLVKSFWNHDQDTRYEVTIENVKTGDSYKLYRLESTYSKGGLRHFVVGTNIEPGEYYFEELIYVGATNADYSNHYYDFKNRVTFKVEKANDVIFIGSYLVDDTNRKEATIAKVGNEKAESYVSNIKQKMQNVDFGSGKDDKLIKKSWEFFGVNAMSVYFLLALDYPLTKWGKIAKSKLNAIKNEKSYPKMMSILSEMTQFQEEKHKNSTKNEASRKRGANF